MTNDDSGLDRRTFLAGAGAATIAASAGCLSGNSGSGGTTTGGDGGSGPTLLKAEGSSTVYPVSNGGARVWNSNPPASDEEYWGPGQYDIDTDERLADYWASKYGFEPTGKKATPPFSLQIGLSHSGTGIEALKAERVDMGNSSAPVAAELPDASQETLDKFTDHVVGVDGQPIVVSRDLYENGVQKLTGEELKGIYKGDITNWSEVGGPDRKMQVVGRATGSGTDTAFRKNLFGDASTKIPGVDVRKGKNQQVAQLIGNSDNAIGYMALAFVEPDGPVPPISLEIEGTTYSYGENLGAKGYPLSRDLHIYTWDGTSKAEAAFLRMILSDFGQQKFVEPKNYFKLPKSRQQTQLEKLPEPSN